MIYKEICSMCGRKVFEERKRTYDKQLASTEIYHVPVCEQCFRDMKI